MSLYKYLDNPKYAESQHYFEVSAAVSRTHRDLMNYALQTYGDHGSTISAIGRDHFPDEVKNELRSLAKEINVQSDFGYGKKPKGVHHMTIVKLAQEVAHKFGIGFYGPAPQAHGKGF